MSLGVGLDPIVVVETAGGLFGLVLFGFIGTQLFASARTANTHLTKAATFNSSARPALEVSHERLAANAARPGADRRWDDDASGQIVARLNEYYAANISQGNVIFWASLLAMSVGFAIIFAGIALAGRNMTAAIVTAVAGVLTQFLGATFLVALRSTQQQSITYAQSLVELRLNDARAAADARAITLGLRLLDEIVGDDAVALANSTRAALAMGLIAKESAPVAPLTTAVAPTLSADTMIRDSSALHERTRAQTVSGDETRTPSAQPATDSKRPS